MAEYSPLIGNRFRGTVNFESSYTKLLLREGKEFAKSKIQEVVDFLSHGFSSSNSDGLQIDSTTTGRDEIRKYGVRVDDVD